MHCRCRRPVHRGSSCDCHAIGSFTCIAHDPVHLWLAVRLQQRVSAGDDVHEPSSRSQCCFLSKQPCPCRCALAGSHAHNWHYHRQWMRSSLSRSIHSGSSNIRECRLCQSGVTICSWSDRKCHCQGSSSARECPSSRSQQRTSLHCSCVCMRSLQCRRR